MAMEKPLNFVIKLPLEEMALRRVVVNLCNETDILISTDNFQMESFFDLNDEKNSKLIEEIKVKVSRLVLPESLKQRMVHLVRPVFLDILDWKISHKRILSTSNFYRDSDILKLLSWTCRGAVDYQKTAENLIHLELLDVTKRYELACLYCLGDCIPDVWRQLPENIKRMYATKTLKDVLQERQVRLEHYWAHSTKKERDDTGRNSSLFPTFHFRALESSAIQGNKAATQYFFQKLTNEKPEKRDSFLFRTAHFIILERHRNPARKYLDFSEKKFSEVLWYVLSLMRTEHRLELIKMRPREVLSCFLDWPLQDFFLDIADLFWTVIPQSEYEYFLDFIPNIIRKSGYYFPNLIQNFYLRSPSGFRKLFVCKLAFFLPQFSYDEDADTLKIFLQDLDLENRWKLVSDLWFLHLLKRLAERDKWHLVKECIRATSLSEELRESLKKNLKEYSPMYRRKWNEFFGSLDETAASEIKF